MKMHKPIAFCPQLLRQSQCMGVHLLLKPAGYEH